MSSIREKRQNEKSEVAHDRLQQSAPSGPAGEKKDYPYWDIGRLIVSFALCVLFVLVVAGIDRCG